MSRVVILRGIPGSGKSTYAAKEYPDYQVCSADHYFTHNGVYTFDAKLLPFSHRSCLDKFLGLLQSNCSGIVVDNTNVHAHEISPYLRLADVFLYDVEIVRLYCDPASAFNRNVHGVPFKTVLDMTRRMDAEVLPPYWKETVVLAQTYVLG